MVVIFARVLVNWNWVGRRAALFGMQRRFLSSGPLSLPDLIITAKAAKRLTSIREGKVPLGALLGPGVSPASVRLRVSIEGGGCSGMSYGFALTTTPPEDGVDRVFTKDGVEVIVDNVSLDFIKGATVDFAEDMMRAAFLITNNPNSEGGCGCGVSFRPKEGEAAGVASTATQ